MIRPENVRCENCCYWGSHMEEGIGFCCRYPVSYAPKLGDGAFTMLPAEMTGHGRCKIHLIWDEDHNAWTMWSSGEIFEEGVSST